MPTRTSYRIAGMSCDHCVRAVTGELEALPGVTDVAVDLESGRATVVAEETLELADVRRAVEEAGYEVVS